MKNRIDIHADDFGYTFNTSKDIIECMKAGCLDSISIICNTSGFDRSAELLYDSIPELPFLPLMSVHLNFPEGKSESNAFPMSWSGLFLSSYGFKREQLKKELKKEIRAQIEKTQEMIERCWEIADRNNIRRTQQALRLDTHVHTHLIPVVWDSLIETVKEEKYEIEYIRNPKEPIGPFLKAANLWPSYSPVNIIKNRILMLYSAKADRFCDEHKIDKMYMCGLMMSGHMDYDRVKTVFPALYEKAEKDGRKLELLFHPGLAYENEYTSEMDIANFKNFNSSDNRHIEKEAVLNIREIMNQGGYDDKKE